EHESWQVLERRGYRPERLDREAMRRRYPKWNADRYRDGYFSPRGGWVESGAVVAWLLASARRAGVRFVEGQVLEVETSGARATGVRVRSESGHEQAVDGTEVVVCAGAWTPGLVPSTAAVLTPVAQPVLHFGVDDPNEYRGPGFPPFAADIAGSGWYGFPALEDGRLKLGHHGPGVPRDPDSRGSVTAEHVAAARAFFSESIPSLGGAPVVGQRVCMYCDSSDGDLLIDRPPHISGLVVAAGGSGHAFKFTPLLGGIIADAVEGRQNRWLARFAWRSPTSSKSEEARYLMTKGRES
ncbi:MAG: FAD-dependent oxidoreductase, partial [Gemmatimonadota bacterium]|nr:FAD-dependent oxidoreductase [Gemmatimonadota bacterium]